MEKFLIFTKADKQLSPPLQQVVQGLKALGSEITILSVTSHNSQLGRIFRQDYQYILVDMYVGASDKALFRNMCELEPAALEELLKASDESCIPESLNLLVVLSAFMPLERPATPIIQFVPQVAAAFKDEFLLWGAHRVLSPDSPDLADDAFYALCQQVAAENRVANDSMDEIFTNEERKRLADFLLTNDEA